VDKILFLVFGRTWRVNATYGYHKDLCKVGERFVTGALKMCSTEVKNYIKTPVLRLDSLISSLVPSPKPPRGILGSDEYWQYPPAGEIAIMICGDSKLVADYACGATRISSTNKFRLAAAFEILHKLWSDGFIVSSHLGAKFVRHIFREDNTEDDVMADYGRRCDHLSSFKSDTVSRPKFLLAKLDGSVREGAMGSEWALYAADSLDANEVRKWVPSAAGCVAMPCVAASAMVSE
jgi:hypothetical protein